jgi:hypothetical protein
MELFVAAAEAGSLSGAAARLGLSNATATAQLQGKRSDEAPGVVRLIVSDLGRRSSTTA